ncbi:MAG TPA: ATP-binding cassette domain-containing protein [Candidatus Megamonas gallistercoris]|nr:ATP-binding cassette domain-containing protein [Candidatus Megamonas gallistercoris]
MVVILQTVICLTWENEINAVMAIAFLLTMQSVLEILATVPALVEYLDEAGRSLTELKLFMKEPQDRQQKESVPDKNTQAVLELKNISYGYKEPLCRNMSFSLYKGRRVLLVGSSGTGKSTLFYLLMRLIEPICGNMYLNGKDYTAWDKQKWRLYFAASFQEHHIFNLSIKDNFKMFYPDITDEEIWRALRAVQLEKFGQKYGLDYVLAAGGINLSGGQKHRMQLAISLARKKDIILLDEPTAGLDIVSAHEFLKQLTAADKEAAMLVASHDLSIADYFDDVIIMGEQKIIEQGDIKMLMQNENSHLHKMMKYNNLI